VLRLCHTVARVPQEIVPLLVIWRGTVCHSRAMRSQTAAAGAFNSMWLDSS
jgi:hypothetical protein